MFSVALTSFSTNSATFSNGQLPSPCTVLIKNLYIQEKFTLELHTIITLRVHHCEHSHI
jgi:hypothetical protein